MTESSHLQQDHPNPNHCCRPDLLTCCCSHSGSPDTANNIKLDKASADIQQHSELLSDLIKKVDALSRTLNTPTAGPPQSQPAPHAPSHTPVDDDPSAKDSSAISLDYAMSDVSLSAEESLNS